MNDEYKNLKLFNNTTGHRFEMRVGDHIVVIVYKMDNDKIVLLHTETPKELQGKGAATAIIEKILAYIENHDYKLVPLCQFVIGYLKKHPEWKRVLDESVINI